MVTIMTIMCLKMREGLGESSNAWKNSLLLLCSSGSVSGGEGWKSCLCKWQLAVSVTGKQLSGEEEENMRHLLHACLL